MTDMRAFQDGHIILQARYFCFDSLQSMHYIIARWLVDGRAGCNSGISTRIIPRFSISIKFCGTTKNEPTVFKTIYLYENEFAHDRFSSLTSQQI